MYIKGGIYTTMLIRMQRIFIVVLMIVILITKVQLLGSFIPFQLDKGSTKSTHDGHMRR